MLPRELKPLIPFPALIIEDSERILVVADLHIGWEMSLTDSGIYIPSQAHKLRTKLLQIIKEHKPNRLIFLGDIKQAVARISMEEWGEVPKFFEALQEHLEDIVVIPGNHDGDLEPLTPSAIKILPSSGLVIGDNPRIGLFHGHAWPSPEVLSSEILVMGHIHPVVWFRDRLGLWTVQQVWVKTKCSGERLARAYLKHRHVKDCRKPREVLEERFGIQVEDPKLIVVPAFNDLVGGVSINRLERRLMGPILHSGGVYMEGAEAYLLDGAYLGTVKQLQTHLTGFA